MNHRGVGPRAGTIEAAAASSFPREIASVRSRRNLPAFAAHAGLILVNPGDMRSEAREYREAIHAKARTDRARIEAAMNLMRAEGRADREAPAKQSTRLVERQGTLNGLADGLRHAIGSPGE